jgi:hypothetical protein
MASEITLTDPLIKPAMSFSIINKVLDAIETLAILVFLLI